MKTVVKILVVLVALGIGFAAGFMIKGSIIKGNFGMIRGQEYMAAKLNSAESYWTPGMPPLQYLDAIEKDLFD